MQIRGNTVQFEPWDRHFAEKFGTEAAAEIVLDYSSQNDLPFIYDTYQLAHFLFVSRKELFQAVRRCNRLYRRIVIKKKNGTDRILFAPTDALKRIQKKILSEILERFEVSKYATAYRKGGQITDNAGPHVGKRYLLKLDITDFFDSIPFEQVYGVVFNTRYFPKQIGVMLCSFCCRNEALPQGAPTSPALSNLVMKRFDDYLGAWCKVRGIAYTRYCDDMTFSSDQPLYAVYRKVQRMLEDTTFELNEKKTRFISRAARQSVTGLTVNEKLSVSRDYKHQLRSEVYYALKYGFEDALIHSKGREEIASAAQYKEHLAGRICYVLQIEPEHVWFKEALKKLKRI